MKIMKRNINSNDEIVFMEYIEELPGIIVVKGLNKFNDVEDVIYCLVDDSYRPKKKENK